MVKATARCRLNDEVLVLAPLTGRGPPPAETPRRYLWVPVMWRVFGGPTNPDAARTGGEGTLYLTFLKPSSGSQSCLPCLPQNISTENIHSLLHILSR
jgi:hypothetical protein